MNAITLRTAYSDLKQLKNLGLVETSNEGRKVIYKASSSLKNEYTEISVYLKIKKRPLKSAPVNRIFNDFSNASVASDF